MSAKQLSSENCKQPDPSLYLLVKRLVLLAIFVVACVLAINFWIYSKEQAQSWHDQQADQLGSSLASQAASTIALIDPQKNPKQTSQYLNLLADDKYVSSVTLFDTGGKLLASTAEQSLIAEYKSLANTPLVFVATVAKNNSKIGYVRLLLDEQKVMQFHSDYQSQLYARLGVLIFVCLVTGFIFARIFYKLRDHYRLRIANQS